MLIAAFFCLTVGALPLAAQNESTFAGGEWNSPLTWVDQKVPTRSSNVTINGPVWVTYGAACRNLTLHADGVLKPEGKETIEFYVYGSVVNKGAIQPGNKGNGLVIRLVGDLVNERVWNVVLTVLIGEVEQQLSLSPGSHFPARCCGAWAALGRRIVAKMKMAL
jgi:hypothetical protein